MPKVQTGLKGRRARESHPHAVLTDREVELLRKLFEEYPRGHPYHWSYGQLAKKFAITKTSVHKIVTYQRR